MAAKPVSRRRFLKTTGVVLGGAALAGSGLAALDSRPPESPLPEFRLGENIMTGKILVAYASRTGSTAGVAEQIGKTLAEGGAAVDVLPVASVQCLQPYRAVIVGSAIQGGQWLPEASAFVKEHRAELAGKPFAAFLVCMTLTMKQGAYRDQAAAWMAPVRALVRPVREGLFAGALDIAKIPSFGDRLKFRLSVMMGVWSEGDHRDWNAIRAWAQDVRTLLGA